MVRFAWMLVFSVTLSYRSKRNGQFDGLIFCETRINLLHEHFPSLYSSLPSKISKLQVNFLQRLGFLRHILCIRPWNSSHVQPIKPYLQHQHPRSCSQGDMAWRLESWSRRLHPLQPRSTARLDATFFVLAPTGCKPSEQKLALWLSYVVICCHMLSYVVICCHMLSYVVICCHMLSYVVICCHMLSYVVIGCHRLS